MREEYVKNSMVGSSRKRYVSGLSRKVYIFQYFADSSVDGKYNFKRPERRQFGYEC